ncbi:putative aminotransferase family protein [Jackrogersella minutella]|nr:putative aminotransferase family protein [Jackrogersella minutella]
MAEAPPATPFGAAFRKAHFAFGPHYTPLNHGSYGMSPVPVRRVHEALRAEVDAEPDPFIALDYHDRLVPQREVAARALNCTDVDKVVLVPNATTGADTVLKNLRWEKGDVILCYELVYCSLEKGLAWLEESQGVDVHIVRLAWPVADDEIVRAIVDAARQINSEPGRRVRLAIIDTIVSMPGIRIPFEMLVPALQTERALVFVDGAHGIGHIDKHRHLIRTTLPTSYRFRPRNTRGQSNAEADSKAFVSMFDFTASDDTTAWLCVQAAFDFRSKVCGGETLITTYSKNVGQQSAAAAAEILSTSVMDCPGSCLQDCAFANVRLPLELHSEVSDWFKVTGVRESGMCFQTIIYRGAWWWRISGMIYVEVEDFRKGAEVLKGLCERVRNGEHVKG